MARMLGRLSLFGWILAVAALSVQAAEPSAKAKAETLSVLTRSYPDPGKILVSVRVLSPADVEDTAKLSLEVKLRAADGDKVVKETAVETEPQMQEEISLDAADLPAGSYTAVVELRQPSGQKLGETTAEVKWPGRSEAFKNIKILNNFVWQLLDLQKSAGGAIEGTHEVSVPYDRWLLVRTKSAAGKPGQVSVSLDSKPLHRHVAGTAETLESMRFVKAGKHAVKVAAEGEAALELLDVRAVPEIQHSRYPSSTQYVKQGLKYDWEYIKPRILPNVNTIISSGFPEEAEPHLREWKQRGGKWISYMGRAAYRGDKDAEEGAEVCAQFYATRPGYSHAMLDGVLVDEFYKPQDPYEMYAAAIRRLNTQFPGRSFYPYAAGLFGQNEGSVEFARACIEGGGYVCWEAYIAEFDNLKSALIGMRAYPRSRIITFEDKLPGLVRHTIWVPAIFSFPWPFADGYASVDYNAYLDMQFQFIATHPALFGLGGVHIWRTGYCDEERLRWCGQFFRHYCLEGRTDRVSDHPYMLTHIQNPDFVDGLKGWKVEAAAKDSITAGNQDGFGKFMGRYYRGPNTFLVTKRQKERPNVFSQEIRGLDSGQLYSVKMFTGDYGDLLEGKSRGAVLPVALTIEGVELLEDPTHSYQTPFATKHEQKPFDKKPFWLNYHWQVFRAKGPTATLRVSDWESPTEPGGPVGQQILHTFVEVKPYLEDTVK